jgi:flagellar motor switch protein FliM
VSQSDASPATGVDREEVSALMEGLGDGVSNADVADRDFRRPRRLSRFELDEAQRRIDQVLSGVEADLSNLLRQEIRLQIQPLEEIHATALFDDLESPPAVVRFRSAGQLGWIRWNVPSAMAAIDRVLGCEPDAGVAAGEPRSLTRLEQAILVRLMQSLVSVISEPLGCECDDFHAISQVKGIGSWRDTERTPDPYRIALELEFATDGGSSNLQLYLPIGEARWAEPGRDPLPWLAENGQPLDIPDHLDRVPLDVRVELARCDLRLNDLLALEVGDVIPLGASRHQPVDVWVDERPFASGRVGRSQGRLAVQLQELTTPPSDQGPAKAGGTAAPKS